MNLLCSQRWPWTDSSMTWAWGCRVASPFWAERNSFSDVFSIFIVKRKLPSGYWQIAVVWLWVGLSEIYILSLSQCNKNFLEVVRPLIGLMAFSWAWVNSHSISSWRIGGHKALLSSCLAFPSNKTHWRFFPIAFGCRVRSWTDRAQIEPPHAGLQASRTVSYICLYSS